ncbi:MAG: carboxypeptidase-like regulatory domain-containing protein, partial [Chitinophagaceae bacterium]
MCLCREQTPRSALFVDPFRIATELSSNFVREMQPVKAKLPVLFLLIFFVQTVFAQKAVSLSGTVVDDASGAPIEYATLSLYVSGDSKQPKNGTTSDAQGRFTLTGAGAGEYELLVESIGYQAYRTGPLSLGGQAVL